MPGISVSGINKRQIPKDISDTDVIIYGHSHKYEERHSGSQIFLNPGSCGPRRFTQPITMAAKYGINEELAQQICRLYLTHPGVDADGIMTKMGL